MTACPAPPLVLPGGFLDHPDGLAATGALLVRLLSGARVLVAPHTVHVHGHQAAWSSANVDARLAASLLKAQASAAAAALGDPAERLVDGLERAAWGTGVRQLHWGDPAEASPDEISALVKAWAQHGTRTPVSDDVFVHRTAADLPWRAGVEVGPAPGARVLVGVAVPLRGEHAVAQAVAAAALLGTPHVGRIPAQLRHELGLCYGSMAVPLVRGRRVALVAGVSTTTRFVADCARRLAAEVRAALSPADPQRWLRQARLVRTVAASRVREGLPVDAFGRCFLEAPEVGDVPAAQDAADRPAWFAHGPVPDAFPDVAREAW